MKRNNKNLNSLQFPLLDPRLKLKRSLGNDDIDHLVQSVKKASERKKDIILTDLSEPDKIYSDLS